jgi:flagellar biosynthesis protein FliR
VIDPAAALHFAIRLVRPGAVVMAAPTIGGAHVPMMVRAGVTVALAIVLVPVSTAGGPLSVGQLPAILVREMAIGLAIAMATRIVVAAAEVAGSLAGVQIGYAYATLIDPQSGAQNGVLSTLYGLMATALLFVANVHHAVIGALGSSYQLLPIGVGAVNPGLVPAVGHALLVVFAVGVQLAAPILVVLLVVDATMGVLSRAVPFLNIMSVGFGIKLLAGLFVLAQTAILMPDVVQRAAAMGLDAAMRLARTIG